MNRKEAIKILSEHQSNLISDADKMNILLDFWYSYESEPEYLNEELIDYLSTHEFDDVEYYSEFFQPVAVSGLVHKNSILNNNYLSKELSNVLLKKIEVFGDEIGRKIKCPCCYFYTLSGRLSYDICSICYWEGPGGDELSYSSANHSTLSEYRNKFFINHDKAELEKYIFNKKADIF